MHLVSFPWGEEALFAHCHHWPLLLLRWEAQAHPVSGHLHFSLGWGHGPTGSPWYLEFQTHGLAGKRLGAPEVELF
jgi:hypothetical protein